MKVDVATKAGDHIGPVISETQFNKIQTLILTDKDKNLIGKKVKLRSPLYCKAQDGICETCLNPVYVKRLQLKPGDKIGLIVATSIGADALVNLTLKKSHVGISLDLEEVNLEEDIFRYAE